MVTILIKTGHNGLGTPGCQAFSDRLVPALPCDTNFCSLGHLAACLLVVQPNAPQVLHQQTISHSVGYHSHPVKSIGGCIVTHSPQMNRHSVDHQNLMCIAPSIHACWTCEDSSSSHGWRGGWLMDIQQPYNNKDLSVRDVRTVWCVLPQVFLIWYTFPQKDRHTLPGGLQHLHHA